jgi:hypothetical protein
MSVQISERLSGKLEPTKNSSNYIDHKTMTRDFTRSHGVATPIGRARSRSYCLSLGLNRFTGLGLLRF